MGPCDVSVGQVSRPGSGGQRPPRLSIASAISASGVWKPKARQVIRRSWVLNCSTRAFAEPVFDRGLDAGALVSDRAREPDERLHAAAARPPKPGVRERWGVLGRDAVDRAQLLVEQGGAIQRLVGARDDRERGALAVGEVLGVLPERKARALELLGRAGLAGLARRIPDVAADLVERVGRRLGHVEGVQADDRVGQRSPSGRVIQSAVSQDTSSIR
jgi:hypothetical protein